MGALRRALVALAACAMLAVPAPAHAVPDDRPSGAALPSPTATPQPDSAVAAPSLRTAAWVLADLDTGTILAAHQPDERLRPASTMKLLTALTVAPRLHPDQQYRAIREDAASEGNRVVLHEGLTYTVKDLLHATLLPSANDAAAALARANGGIEATLQQMGAEAARLGARATTPRNPSGLDAPGQLTTARDMALIGRAAFANPEIAGYMKLRSVAFPGKGEDGQPVRYPIYNQNRMLFDRFRGAIGGKAGYTSGALRTLVAATERDGRRLLISMLGIRGNTYTTGERLLEWGFAHATVLRPVGQLPDPSAPAQAQQRVATPLPEPSTPPQQEPANGTTARGPTSQEPPKDAPTATVGASGGAFPRLPLPGLPPPLTTLTLATGLVAVLRARVYWTEHRQRTAWITLEGWVRAHPRSARRREREREREREQERLAALGGGPGAQHPGETPPARTGGPQKDPTLVGARP
jgi:D-alanyl-D-alanine carboxypeptidase (penicillin-binding protein 5/6)